MAAKISTAASKMKKELWSYMMGKVDKDDSFVSFQKFTADTFFERLWLGYIFLP